jgi:glycerol transport system substrate-binding protein
MIKTLKTIFTVAVFSIVTISSSFADGHMAAIKE